MKRTVRDLVNLEGKVVLLRVDFNVPMDEGGKILDSTRIMQSLPTIKYLIEQKAKVVIMSHLGRPKGFRNQKIALAHRTYFDEIAANNGVLFKQSGGQRVEEQIKSMDNGDVLLLENVRFYQEEVNCDMNFAKKIASMGDIFVNDAFGVAHREHATTYASCKADAKRNRLFDGKRNFCSFWSS